MKVLPRQLMLWITREGGGGKGHPRATAHPVHCAGLQLDLTAD